MFYFIKELSTTFISSNILEMTTNSCYLRLGTSDPTDYDDNIMFSSILRVTISVFKDNIFFLYKQANCLQYLYALMFRREYELARPFVCKC